MKRLLIPAALALGAMAALVLAARRDLSEPHLRLFNEMVVSPAAKTQTANALLPGGLTQQAAPAGTFPRGGSTLHYGPSLEERARAARELKNPLSVSLDGLERGRAAYQRNCLHCHAAMVQEIVSHEDVARGELRCIGCHRSVGHLSLD